MWTLLDRHPLLALAAVAVERFEQGRLGAAELVRLVQVLAPSPKWGPKQERLLKIMGEQIKANAATIDSFGLERFVSPPFSFRGGINRAINVFGGQDRLETVLEDLNRAVFVNGGHNEQSQSGAA
jgi:hypothetical protein